MYIFVDAIYRQKVQGLCGNFDGDATNDLVIAGTTVTDVIQEVGNSWKTNPSCPEVNKDTTDSFDPCERNVNRQPWAQEECRIIITGSIFELCRQAVDDYMDYYEECLFDSCA